MNKEWAERWADFLEQPGLKQAKGSLCVGKGHFEAPKCCLGHLEFLIGNILENAGRSDEGWVRTSVCSPEGELLKSNQHSDFLSPSTAKRVGMRTVTGAWNRQHYAPIWHGDGSCISLAELNDREMPLAEIAKVIRERYEAL